MVKRATSKPSAEELVIVEAPVFSASVFRVQATSNSFTLVCQRPRSTTKLDGTFTNVAKLETTVLVELSPQSAKDLLLILQSNVAGYEKQNGEIVTDYTRRLSKK